MARYAKRFHDRVLNVLRLPPAPTSAPAATISVMGWPERLDVAVLNGLPFRLTPRRASWSLAS